MAAMAAELHFFCRKYAKNTLIVCDARIVC